MLKMFRLVLILATLAVLEARSPVIDADNKCMEKFEISSQDIYDVFLVVPNETDGIDRKFKCYAKCLMDELNYKDENGKMDFRRVVEKSKHPRGIDFALQATADCEAKFNLVTEECELAFKMFACMSIALDTNPRYEHKD